MSMKMASTGGHEVGVAWDDGAHENVTKIQISHDLLGVNFIKFEYLDGAEIVTGEQYLTESDTCLTGDEYGHGKISDNSPVTEEFELEPDEYITEAETYVNFIGNAIGHVLMFIFKTNKRTSKAYGLDQFPYGRTKIVLGEKNKKIVGFHGNSGDHILHAIGVYVSPINKTKTFKQRVSKYLHKIKNKLI